VVVHVDGLAEVPALWLVTFSGVQLLALGAGLPALESLVRDADWSWWSMACGGARVALGNAGGALGSASLPCGYLSLTLSESATCVSESAICLSWTVPGIVDAAPRLTLAAVWFSVGVA